jgi:hypothetical protein
MKNLLIVSVLFFSHFAGAQSARGWSETCDSFLQQEFFSWVADKGAEFIGAQEISRDEVEKTLEKSNWPSTEAKANFAKYLTREGVGFYSVADTYWSGVSITVFAVAKDNCELLEGLTVYVE